ncbi:hypothetical protein Aph01nite_47170 [Acrocarpospora phusangensis]|uniref:SEC-C motif-containing protein n=1 Tax=Acrocarpospora phusangensis TaxID=1070424 RepID=A0A919QCH7_9ACTN|nr:SEC-C domain-containing protein [Acrocarpospora phusangensis]GIH26407.1 hypothetical protein Aph01nite_47170 [Acrocarpospora phusangensis]
MLPDHLFQPLDLDRALDRAYDRGEERAAWELLADALLDPRARGDVSLRAYVEVLVDEYTPDGWERDTLAVLGDLADAEPGLRGALRLPMAELHAQVGEDETALRLLRARQRELAGLPKAERDEEFYPAAAMVAGGADPRFARALLDDGLALAMDLGRPEAAVRYLSLLRKRFGGGEDPEVTAYLEGAQEPVQAVPHAVQPEMPRKPAVRMPYEEGADLKALEKGFREADLAARVAVVRVAAGQSVDAVDPAGDLAWPPGRNEPCWCGGGRKYKKCCGSPV